MAAPPVGSVDVLALAGKLLAGSGVATVLYLLARVLFKARSYALIGGIAFLIVAVAVVLDVLRVNPGRLAELGRLGWELGLWARRALGLGI
jgi:uncharacterized membrane protein